MKYPGCCILLLLLLYGCEKTVNLELDKQPAELVVDASIESGMPPVVVLSNSLNYFSVIGPAQLQASFVRNAKVVVNDGVKDHVLREFSTNIRGGYKAYYYSVTRTDAANYFTGAFNQKYTLRIQLGDSAGYTAATTIPRLAKTCDSIWWKQAPNNPDTTKAVVFGRFADPKGLGNYTRYFTKVNSAPFYPGLTSAFDDQLTDGTVYSLRIDRGYDKNSSIDFTSDDYGFYFRGDTVTLKFTNIDKASFDFWRTWDYNYQTNGNPFSTPGKVLGNISNNALGAFCGYAVQYRTVIIPK